MVQSLRQRYSTAAKAADADILRPCPEAFITLGVPTELLDPVV